MVLLFFEIFIFIIIYFLVLYSVTITIIIIDIMIVVMLLTVLIIKNNERIFPGLKEKGKYLRSCRHSNSLLAFVEASLCKKYQWVKITVDMVYTDTYPGEALLSLIAYYKRSDDKGFVLKGIMP